MQSNTRSRLCRRHALPRGFSLVEMLVVISLITLVVSITMPALSRAREQGRDAQCKSNLRQIGLGISQYSDTHTTLCSGAWDWKHDGCLTEVGWVADLVQSGIPLDQLKCQSNNLRMNEQFQVALTLDAENNPCANSLGQTSRYVDGQKVDNICREMAKKSTPADRVDILQGLLEDGYNTNYVATWLMVRSDVQLQSNGSLMGGDAGCLPSLANRKSTVGPMNKARMGMSKISSTTIPLVACGQMANLPNGLLNEEIADYPSGSRLSATMTAGPVDVKTMRVPVAGAATGFTAWGPMWQNTLQDYRNFAPVHAGSCNVLFLDLSVQHFVDENRDGLLNNGFKPSASNSFIDDQLELPPARIYSGWSLNPSRITSR